MVLLTLDTTRADHLGCYGYPEDVSPHLDALAGQGTLFTRAIAQAAVTPVSHASMLTGLNPYAHGLRVLHGTSENRLPEDRTTLAELFREAGYRTAAFVSAFPVSERFGLAQGFERFDEDFAATPLERVVSPDGVVDTGRNQRHAGETTRRALEWLAASPEPFFLWVHYFDPHDPLVGPPREFVQSYRVPGGPPRDPRSLWRAYYDMEIRYMDSEIGRLLGALEERGLWDRSMIAVVADHGEGLGDHDWWSHGILYQEQIRVPLILRAPGQPGSRRVDHVVRTIDLFPTILELAGIDVPESEGHSLVEMLSGDTPDPGLVAYSDSLNMLTYRIHPQIIDEKDERLFSVLRWPWKYIYHELRPEESELFQLAQDPGETRNRITQQPEVAARMHALLESFDFAPREGAPGEALSPEDRERLRALGYAE